jgi:hypothetical protein
MSIQTTAQAAKQQNPEYMQQAEGAFQSMLARSATDMEFRQKLLTDPRAALAEFSGKDVSELTTTFNVRFIENKADATIVLPDPVDPAAELSEADLEAVAGGASPVVLGIIASALWISAEVIGAYKDAN